jgi:putative oxidoreductase
MTNSRAWLSRLLQTRAPGAVLWIRFYVGAVFLSEGILKFVRTTSLGTGRFSKVGIPAPAFFASLDAVLEIGCGLLILAGLLTRLAAVPMVIDMIGALLITKFPLLWGHVALFKGESGWWDFAHESRVEVAQLCGSVFLLLVGAGRYSLDARLHHTLTHEAAPR